MTSLRLCVRRSSITDETGPGARITLRLPSDVACIEEAVALLTYHCLGGGEDRGRMRFRLEVVLAEAIANAIVRGNRQDPGKSVQVAVRLRGPDIRIDVTDEGDGFDPATVPEPVTPQRVLEEHGRGIFLIRHLADQVVFNERGNSVCVILLRR
ncbi:MAG TPA: ATP-binding protein [Gemmatimonadales bacterium]|jgi:serine/threonine-protein kinase RsbW|nr:ATP-binding protein [Gemmatimonadales bacterium]